MMEVPDTAAFPVKDHISPVIDDGQRDQLSWVPPLKRIMTDSSDKDDRQRTKHRNDDRRRQRRRSSKQRKRSYSSDSSSSSTKKKRKKKRAKRMKERVMIEQGKSVEMVVAPVEAPATVTVAKKNPMIPMTKESWERQQSQITEVYDEQSGRYRLVRGSGEIIERIVSRSNHESINRTATRGDGASFSRCIFATVKK